MPTQTQLKVEDQIKQIREAVHIVAAPIYAALFLIGVNVIIYQCYKWFATGLWKRISLADGWYLLFKTPPPLADWVGIFKLESAVPMSLFFIAMSIVAFWLTFTFFED